MESLKQQGKSMPKRSYVDFTDDDKSFGARWYRFVVTWIHQPVTRRLITIARTSAHNPKTTIVAVVSISLILFIVGIFTGFKVNVDKDTLWTPRDSLAMSHYNWIERDSGFPGAPRPLRVIVHANGDSVVGVQGMDLLFIVLETIHETSGYDQVCGNTSSSCNMISPTGFWNHSRAHFLNQTTNDEDVLRALSQSNYPDGMPVDLLMIVGNPTFDTNGSLLESPSLVMTFNLRPVNEVETFEQEVLSKLLDLQSAWIQDEQHSYRLEVFAARSFSDEFSRAIITDIPLLPIAFIVMSIYTSLVFWKRDPVQSRTSLGFGAVCSVLLAISTSYGLMFIFGVPFTSLTQILPFIMFGIGIDDAFIMTGSFHRTSHDRDILLRIEDTMVEVGLSITITTVTSAVAFGFGCMSTIPAVTWLCLYAFPTILIDFLYQITLFVAIMALDEQRVREKRIDCIVCVKMNKTSNENKEGLEEEDPSIDGTSKPGTLEKSFPDRIMEWYAEKIVHLGWVKWLVVLCFAGFTAVCAYSASKLEQSFDFTEVVPKDSYLSTFDTAMNTYTSQGGAYINVYFRNVDQSLSEIRDQMENFVNDLVNMEQIERQPRFFWVRDFAAFLDANQALEGQPFYEQLHAFYNSSVYKLTYGDDIVLDPMGMISASRTHLYMNKVDGREVKEVIQALNDQYVISSNQPVNAGMEELSFFTYSSMYLSWEFYSVAVNEFILSTMTSIFSVTVIATLSMPHWTAVLYVLPLMCMLFVELLGVLQFFGVSIEPVSYISVVMSIGLLVDFVFHMLLRFYEVKGDRSQRTKEMLETMGSSMMLAGFSTFLGVVPLAFSTSTIFFTIFLTFMALVALGMSHALVLIPILLSMWGPECKLVEDQGDRDEREHASVIAGRNL